MPLAHVFVLAALQGLSEALPVSRSGHDAVARIWIEPGSSAAALTAVLHLGTALALGVAARTRLFAVLSEGVRAIARPPLFRSSPGAHDAGLLVLGVGFSLATTELVSPHLAPFLALPIAAGAAGIGLAITGLALASTALVLRLNGAPGAVAMRRLRGDAPSVPEMMLIGIAHGLAIFPGASGVGMALVLLLWFGVRPVRAADLAFLLTIPSLLVAAFDGVLGQGGASGLEATALAVGLPLAFLSATAACAAVRALLTQRRLAALALWTIPLGLSLLAYARALPHSG